MTTSTFDTRITLKIETLNELSEISNIIGLSPTTTIPAGESQHRILPKAACNIWMLSLKFNSCTNTEGLISKFFSTIPNCLTCIESIKEIGTCVIRLSIVTDNAQLGFNISAEDIQLLSQLNIALVCSVR